MNLSKWVGAAAFVLLAGMAAIAAAEATREKSDSKVTGVVASIGDGKITVTVDGKDQVLAVAKDADVTSDGKACKLEDLKKGESVAVTLKKNADSTVATKVEAKSAAAAAPAVGLYFNDKVDSSDDSQLWTMQKEGDYVLLISKSGKSALDVNNEKGNLYLNDKIDPKNNNQLWTIKAEGDYSMIVPKVGAGILSKGALDADNAKDKPYVNAKADAANNNELWTLEKHGDFYVIQPKGHKVALSVRAASPDKADNVVSGVVASAGDGKITVTVDGKDQVLTVAKDADVTSDGKACKLEDLKKGASVAVTLKKSGDSTVATKVDAKKQP
jgi:DNA-binding protein YbaB